jgi:RND family efflux transporter MFP subunit
MSGPAAKKSPLLKIVAVLVVLAAGVVATLYSMRPTALVAEVRRGTAADVVTGTVTVYADNDEQDIKSEFGGRVARIYPDLDKPLKAGDPIVELDTVDLDREIRQAEADRKLQDDGREALKKADKRGEVAAEKLADAERRNKEGQLSADDLKSAKREYDKTIADLKAADIEAERDKVRFENDIAAKKRQLEKMIIRAPSDGRLKAVLVAPGALIGGSTSVAKFYSNQRVVKAQVAEEAISRVKVGQSAQVRLLALGNKLLDAKVSLILPFAEPDTQRHTVHLDVKASPDELMPFSTGEVTITVASHDNQPLIPRRALAANDEYVLVVRGGVVERRKVSIGFKALNYAEVTANLKEGELVIVDDIDRFRDGQHVRIENTDKGAN